MFDYLRIVPLESLQVEMQTRLPRPVTVAGDVVSGRVDIRIKRPVEIHSIEVRLGCESIGRVKIVTGIRTRAYEIFVGQRYLERQKLFQPLERNVTVSKDLLGYEFEFTLPYDVQLSSYHVLPSDSRVEWFVETLVKSGGPSGDILAQARYPFEFRSQPITWIEKCDEPLTINKSFTERSWWQLLCLRNQPDDRLEMMLKLPKSQKVARHPAPLAVSLDLVARDPNRPPPSVERITIWLKSKRTMTVATTDGSYQSFMRDETVLVDEPTVDLEHAQRIMLSTTIPANHHESFSTPQLRLDYKLVVELSAEGRKLRLSSPVELLNTLSEGDLEYLPPYMSKDS